MNGFDDSDIKIADGSSEAAHTDDIDTMAFIEEAKRQHFNGNTAKAKLLGRGIVSAFSYKSAPDELFAAAKRHGIDPDPKTVLQIKFLSVFSAEYSLEHFLPSQHLSAVAVDEMYDVMRENEPEFFDSLARSSAFSFYYLCTSDGGNIADSVAREFAKLCGRTDDDRFVSLGKELFEVNVNVFCRAVNGFVFV